MNKKHFFYWVTVVTFCMALFSACIKEHVAGITLNKSELMLILGETETLIATVEPGDATNKNVTWKSSNTAIATVNHQGLVTAIKDGKATITVTTKDGKKTATCRVTVDYRAKWVGDWDFEINRHWWSGIGEGFTEGDTIYYYLGKISIGNTSNQLIIDYIRNISLIMTVDESGKLLTIEDHPFGYIGNGQFDRNDKVHIKRAGGYGLGGGGRDAVNGTKITKGGKNE